MTARVRPGFTLVELLVVIGIILLLMGLSVASVVSGPRVQRMVAAEQVVADCIRQARHTARTTGQPVVLKLQRQERTVSGLVRTSLWHGVEGPGAGESWPQSEWFDGTTWRRVDTPGVTGTGLDLPGAYQESGVTNIGRAVWAGSADLIGHKRLWRGQAPSRPEMRPGLLLSVSVRPPIAGTAGIPDVLPLVLVSDSAHADVASYESSPLGLALVLSTSTTGSGPVSTRGNQKSVASWEVIGWFGVSPSIEVSSISNAPKDFADAGLADNREVAIVERYPDSVSGPVTDKEFTESQALFGGRWIELALLVESDRLVLYMDGRRVGEKLGALSTRVPAGQAERVFVGVATLAAGQQPTIATSVTIDDVRIERMGDALAGNLPPGVMPKENYRVICHPDGRVEVNSNAGDELATTIVLEADGTTGAELIVSITGSVTSKTLVGP